MKKFIAILAAIATVFSLATVSFAEDCAHANMTETYVEASCLSRAYTIYECSDCGYYSVEYALADVDAPAGYHFIFDANVDNGGLLEVTCYAAGNPGVYSNRFTLKFNPDALTPQFVSNGDVWTDGEALHSINTQKNYIRYFADTDGTNTKNGIVFSVFFSVNSTDPSAWGLKIDTIAEDFIDYEGNNVPFTVINAIGKGFDAEAHKWNDGEVTLEPTYEAVGTMTYTCLLCGATKTEDIPMLEGYMKGDINNDGKINLADIYLCKTLVVQGTDNFDPLGVDAADMNSDGKINLSDIMLLKAEVLK